jgi:Tfp pilus assembly protein PilF
MSRRKATQPPALERRNSSGLIVPSMKTFLISISILVSFQLVMGQDPHDPFQNVEPDLVRQVDLAKQKQADGSDPKQNDEAKALLKEAIRRKPDYYRALYNLSLIYLAENEADKAVEAMSQAKKIHDKEGLHDNSILNALGWAYLNAGDLKNAEYYLNEAYKTMSENDAPTNERILNNLGYVYLQEGKTTEARKFLEQSRIQFNSSRAISTLSLVNDYERRQNATESSAQLWAVYGQQPKAGGAWTERHFDVRGGDKKAIPRAGNTVAALDNVYVRTATPVWDDNSKEYVSGPIVGYIKPGDSLQVLEVVDNGIQNAVKDPNAWYWIRFVRSSKH